jgi:toxin ParE1/3/4
MRLEWSQQAVADMSAIWKYIAERNPAAAEKVRTRIVKALDLVARHPYMGRIGQVPDTREFVFTDIPYIGVYNIDMEMQQITVINVVHTARLYPPQTSE